MAPTPDAILFDLDGTLLDSLGSIGTAMNDALARLSLPPHPLEAYRRFVGDGVRALAERVLSPGERHRADALIEAYRPLYRARQLEAPLYEGIMAMVGRVAAHGVPMAVLTNKPDDLAGEIVGALFAPGTFAITRGERADEPRKPDPTVALALARLMNARPARCWFVGDTPTDIETARAAEMLPVGVAWGFRSREELLAAGARVLVPTPADLVELLENKQ
jgi:phosphoglycolate phosphatase